ncbi:PHP domain-containing protein [Desulfococcus sp.]|uniref:PHP domain-containing protein n=1 Tax=Desulfococcus sp. TaxID=2025834 RepID=UPI0035933A1B
MMDRRRHRFRRWFNRVIDAVSFNDQIRDLVEMLNRKVEQTEEATPDLLSHPGGFTRAFRKRRMGIAESYIRIAQKLIHSNVRDRLHALKTLVAFSLHAKTISMPLNTARVQTEIMKEAVKNIRNRRRQMEMIADFSLASYGHEATIRRFLQELRRLEVPETDQPLKNLDMGWDAHVHDNLSEGRKTPSQLVLDAFIKGISRLTLAYYDIPHRDIIFEAMEAGRILGVEVSIGIEFSVGRRTRRKHFLFLPPAVTCDAFLEFFNLNCGVLAHFYDGLEENTNHRRRVITEILENFNRTHRIEINQGFPEDGIFALQPLQLSDLERIVPHGQFSRNHLSELIYEQLKEVLKKRVLLLKAQFEIARQMFREDILTGWEFEQVLTAYRQVRKRYTALSPAEIKSEYFSGKNIIDYDSAFASEAEIMPDLKKSGAVIVFNRPLEHGFESAVETVLAAHPHIDQIELMNMRDSMGRDPTEIIRLTRFVSLVNTGALPELKRFLNDFHSRTVDPGLAGNALEKYHQDPLIPLAASAATGWKPQVPGMGFIRESRIPKKSRKYFCQTHYRLPRPVSDLINGAGRTSNTDPNSPGTIDEIYCLGKSGHFRPNLVGDEAHIEKIGPLRTWRYLNPSLKNIIRVAIGVIPAYLWIGWEYTLVWFGITFFRNVFVDLVAFSGPRPKAWSIRDVNFDNTTQSLFWTGFSVPLLGMVKLGFDYSWTFAFTGLLFVWLKFLVICIANGLYISAHNKLRRFDNRVIRANFFRSVLAWPFSAAFSPLGNMLLVPSIVQAKFWSDVVAAVIEGMGKFQQKIVLRKRDYRELLPLLRSEDRETRMTAMMDILYIWGKRQRGASGLAQILRGRWGPATSRGVFKKIDPEKKKAHAASGAAYLDLMIAMFAPHQVTPEIPRFILTKYTHHEVIVLIDMLDAHLIPFHSWLKNLRKSAGKDLPPTPADAL